MSLLIVSLFVGVGVYVPGLMLSTLILKERDFNQHFGLSFCFGFLQFTIAGYLGYLFQLTFSNLSLIYAIVVVGILVVFILKKGWKKLVVNKSTAFLLLFSAAAFLLCLFSGWIYRGDSFVHIQSIRNLMGDGTITQPYYGLVNQNLIPDHMYDTYWLLIGAISNLSSIELTQVWHYLSPALALVLPFSIYTFGRNVFRKHRLGIISVVVFFILAAFYSSLMYGTVFDALVYPNRVYLWLLLPVLIVFTSRYVESGIKGSLFTVPVLMLPLLLTHQSGFLLYFAMFGGVAILLIIARKWQDFKRLISCLGLTLLISIPLLIQKMAGNSDYIAKSSSNAWHDHYVFHYVTDDLFAFSMNRYFVLGMFVSLALAVLLLIFRKRLKLPEFASFIIAASFVFSLLVVFNPFVVPFLSKVISYVGVVRLFRLPLYFLLGTSLIYILINRFPLLLKAKNIAVIIVFVLLIMQMWQLYSQHDVVHVYPEITEISKEIDKNSVVLSDPVTSSDLLVFNQMKVLCIRFNGAVDLVDIDEEKEFVSSVFLKETMGEELQRELKRRNVDYIVQNKIDYPERLEEEYFQNEKETTNFIFYSIKY
jgi:hypothetical protein